MVVEYGSKQLIKICMDDKRLIRKMGDKSARTFILRIAQMRAFETLGQYLRHGLGHPELLSGWHRLPAGSVRLTGNQRIIFWPELSEGATDINSCTKITVEGVVDYHGSSSTDWYIP